MQSPPISPAEIQIRINGHLDELLKLWWDEQGACKPRDLQLMASIAPFPRDQPLRVLDLCCGPGDAGRAVLQSYPNGRIDFLDRDPFLTSLCAGVNRRDGVPGRVMTFDLREKGWDRELHRDYDIVVVANAIHWLSPTDAARVAREIHALLRPGGVFVFAEPTSAEEPFAVGFASWKSSRPPRYTAENWRRFWLRANAILGYDHVKLMGERQAKRIDERMTTGGWSRLISDAGFVNIDILWRDADQAIIAALKP